jgi:dihydropyrimidinase
LTEVCDAASRRVCVDFSFHAVVRDPRPDVIAEVPGLVRDGFPSFKFFTMFPAFMARGPEHLNILRAIGASGGLAMIHCEDGSIIDHCSQLLFDAGRTGAAHYAASRPREVEWSATARAMQLAAIADVPVYIVHLSCEGALDETRRARARGLPVYVETRPLYLHLTDERLRDDDREAAKYVGVPPLRGVYEQQMLWTALRAGDVHTVQSDHVGLTFAEKYKPGSTFDTIPAGVANLETLVPMLYSEGVAKGRLTAERFVEVIATNPAKLFGMYPRKGTIAVGSDADLCIFDPAKKVTVRGSELNSASDYTVYEGFDVTGWPVTTLLRGAVIFQDGEVLAEPGHGRLVARSRFRGL